MAVRAERLPILLGPEERLITSVRLDMVHEGSRDHAIVELVMRAQWMVGEVGEPGSFPGCAVSPLSCGAASVIVHALPRMLMASATRAPALDKLGTAGRCAVLQ